MRLQFAGKSRVGGGHSSRVAQLWIVRPQHITNIMHSEYKPLESCNNYLRDALEEFKKDETNRGLQSLTMAFQELVGWAHEVDKKLKSSDGN